MADKDKNLYDYKSYFELIIDGNHYEIDEPVNWDKITINNPRDLESFSFSFEFVDDSMQLQFPNDDVSYNLIKNVYDSQSGDGQITLEYGYFLTDTSEKSKQYEGKLNLNTYVDEDGAITCSVEKQDFENKFNTRFETSISFSDTNNLDNEPILPLAPVRVKLHSKKIIKAFKAETITPASAEVAASRFMHIQIDTSNEVQSELLQNQALPLGISGQDPRNELRYFFKAVDSGHCSLNMQAKFNLQILRDDWLGQVNDWFIMPRFVIERAGVTIYLEDLVDFKRSGSGNSKSVYVTNYEFNYSHQFELLADDVLYLEVHGTMGSAGQDYIYRVSEYTGFVELTSDTEAPASFANCYRLFDAINHMVESATGQTGRVKSSILGQGGAMYSTFITNGFQIRNFQVDDKPTITNIKDFLTSVCAIGGLGYGVSLIAGVEVLTIEPVGYFFKDSEIQVLEDVFDYREEHAKELVHNEVEIGYEKFQEEGLNSLDEFNTFQTLLLPIKTYKSKFAKRSKYIASGYSIEAQRREQFAENPSESLSDDDNIFVIACNENNRLIATGFRTYPAYNEIWFIRSFNLAVGTVFQIEGGENNANSGTEFTVITSDPTVDIYTVTPSPINDQGDGVVIIANSQVEAETNQMFPFIRNLYSPESAYNLRYSPRRMLYNWSRYLNIGLNKKADSELIKTTFMKQNSKLISTLASVDQHRRFEPEGPLVESEDIPLAVFRAGTRKELHSDKFSFFKCNIKFSAYMHLMERLTGKAQDVNDNGFVVYPDDKGNMLNGYVYNAKYQPVDEVAEFQVAIIGIYN